MKYQVFTDYYVNLNNFLTKVYTQQYNLSVYSQSSAYLYNLIVYVQISHCTSTSMHQLVLRLYIPVRSMYHLVYVQFILCTSQPMYNRTSYSMCKLVNQQKLVYVYKFVTVNTSQFISQSMYYLVNGIVSEFITQIYVPLSLCSNKCISATVSIRISQSMYMYQYVSLYTSTPVMYIKASVQWLDSIGIESKEIHESLSVGSEKCL